VLGALSWGSLGLALGAALDGAHKTAYGATGAMVVLFTLAMMTDPDL
jgi:hypothetical protein